MVSLLTATAAASGSRPLSPTSPSSISSASTSLLEPSEPALVMSLFGWEPSLSHAPATTIGSANRRSTLSQSLSRATSVTLAKNGNTALALSSNNSGIRHSIDGRASPSPSSPTTPHGPSVDEKDVTVACQLCQRRLGLWAFSSTPPVANGAAPNAPGSPRLKTKARTLDVLKEHRSFCPYVVRSTPLPSFPGTSQQATSRPATPVGSNGNQLVEGWKAMLSVVGRSGLGMRRRKSDIFGNANALSTAEGDVGEGADVDSMVESVKKGGVRQPGSLLTYTTEHTIIFQSRELMKYVKGLLG